MKFAVPLISALSLYVASTEGAQCQLATDRGAPVWKNWQQYPQAINSTIAFFQKKNISPAFSRCIGSADISALDAVGLFMNKDCKNAIHEVMPNFDTTSKDTTLSPVYRDIFEHLQVITSSTPATLISNLRQQKDWSLKQGPELSSKICANVRNNAVPCVEKAVTKLLFNQAFDNACCDDLKAEFKNRFTGYELTRENVNRAVRDIVNIPCAIQTPGFSGKDQTCLYTGAQVLFSGDYVDNFKSSISTKENSVCQAANGDPFSTYSSSAAKQYKRASGCCVAPLDKVASVIGTFPFVRNLIPPEATAPGKCLAAANLPFIQTLLQQTPPELQSAAKNFVDGLCVHYTIGYAKSCSFTTGKTCNLL